MTTLEIRNLLGISRAEFSRRYGIPVRTLEEGDSGRHSPRGWVLALLERVVREDIASEAKARTEATEASREVE